MLLKLLENLAKMQERDTLLTCFLIHEFLSFEKNGLEVKTMDSRPIAIGGDCIHLACFMTIKLM